MKVCVYDAGAVGGYLAGVMAHHGAHAGLDVSVVARGEHLAAIRSNGLVVELPDGPIAGKVNASDNPADLGPQDVVIVSVKVPSLPGIAAGLPALLKPDTPVVFLNNGIPWWYYQGLTGPDAGKRLPRLDPGDGLLNAVGPDRTIGGVFWPACTVPRPGVIRIIAVGGKGTILGTPSGELTQGLRRVADAFHHAGLQAETTPRIRDVIWEKLAFNLSAGPMCVLTTTPVKDTHVEEACITASRNLVSEALALIRAMGCHVQLDMDRITAANRQLAHRPSILQDLLAGRRMEIISLYVTPLDMARDAGVKMPTLELLAGLIKVRARAAGLYDG